MAKGKLTEEKGKDFLSPDSNKYGSVTRKAGEVLKCRMEPPVPLPVDCGHNSAHMGRNKE